MFSTIPISKSRRRTRAPRSLTVALALAFIAANASDTPAAADSSAAVAINRPSDAGQTTRILNPGVVSWVHFGDLHITSGDQQNYADFKAIIANTNQFLLNGVNFAFLPGDNANDDTAAEYQLIKSATDLLKVPTYAVPGDHDRKGGLEAFQRYMEPRLYQSFSADIYHFVFLDVMGGISSDERSWLTSDLAAAKSAGLKSVLFMHSYNVTSDIRELIQNDNVIMVDAGHTHTNNVANDGRTVYAATRSTGQISEGPVGFSVVNLDGGVVSWKFKPLGSWPFVMITSPADKVLAISGNSSVRGGTNVRAKVWDDKGVASVSMQIDGGTAQPMARIGSTQMWNARYDFSSMASGDHKIAVAVRGAGGNTTQDAITVAVNPTTAVEARAFGPSSNSVGMYAEKGLLGNSGGGHGPGGGGHGGKGHPGGAPAAAADAAGLRGLGSQAEAQSGLREAPAPTKVAGPDSSGGGKHGKHGKHGNAAPTRRDAGCGEASDGNRAETGTGAPGPQNPGPGGRGGGHSRPTVATLVGLNGTSLTVRMADGSTQNLRYDATTRFIEESGGVDRPASSSSLRVGQRLEIDFAPAAAGATAQTSRIEITPSGS